MQIIIKTAALACVTVVIAAALIAAALWQQHQRSPVAPTVYGSLFALQRMAPHLFDEHIRERIDAALEDDTLTHEELAEIEAALPPLGVPLREALNTPAQPDPLAPMPDAEAEARKPGVGERLGNAFDTLLDSLQRRYHEFSGPPQKTEPPAEL